ncbi:MAG: hypothetical protein Q6373_018790 [Candidatus Sigynarchaeota archaeon]
MKKKPALFQLTIDIIASKSGVTLGPVLPARPFGSFCPRMCQGKAMKRL